MDREIKNEFGKLAVMIKSGFDDVDKRFKNVDKRFEDIDKRFESVDKRFDTMATKEDMNKNKLEMQDFITGKIAELKGEMVVLTRTEDKKLFCLIDKLGRKKILTKRDINQLSGMKPFPRTVA